MEKEETLFSEYKETLNILKDKHNSLSEFNYFLDASNEENIFKNKAPNGRVIMISHSFPDEIIRSLNLTPCYVFGGSNRTSKIGDEYLPKDINDQAKSILGILKSKAFNLNKKDVLLIPNSSDTYRTIAVILKDITTIIAYDIPSNVNDKLLQKRYISEIKRVIFELKKHFKVHFSKKEFIKQCEISLKSAQNFDKLEEIYIKNSSILSLSGFLFLINSYYSALDKNEWSTHIDKLVIELSKNPNQDDETKKKILLMGSPIYMPNFKTLFEIERLNLNVRFVWHPDISYIKNLLKFSNSSFSLKNVILSYLNSSSYFTSPHSLLGGQKVDAIIYHLIKGTNQFSYYFQNVEKELAKNDLAIIKIETVYDFNDIEQIKLRLESFSEIIIK